MPRRSEPDKYGYWYSYVDRGDLRVRWLQPAVTADAKPQAFTLTFKHKRDVTRFRDYLEDWKGDVDRNSPVVTERLYLHHTARTPVPPDTAASTAETFYKYATRQIDKNRGTAEATERVSRYRLDRASIELEDGRSLHTTPVADVNDDLLFDIQKAIIAHRWGKNSDRSYARTTIRHTMTFIMGIVRDAQRDGLIPLNKVTEFKPMKAQRRQTERAMTRADWAEIRKFARSRQQTLLFDLLAASGCRLGEATYLEASSIRLLRNGQAKMLILGTFLSDGESQDYTKNETTRTVRIPRRLAEELRAFAEEHRRTDGLLFRAVRKEGGQLRHQTAEHQFESMVKKAVRAGVVIDWPHERGLPTPHSLRHSYVTWSLMATVGDDDRRISPKTIATRTGHSMQELWNTYVASLNDDDDTFDEWLNGIDPWATQPSAELVASGSRYPETGPADGNSPDSHAA